MREIARALRDVFTLRNLGGGGEGCNDRDEAFSQTRRWLHHAMFYGFFACFAATCIATIDHFWLGRALPAAQRAGHPGNRRRYRADRRHGRFLVGENRRRSRASPQDCLAPNGFQSCSDWHRSPGWRCSLCANRRNGDSFAIHLGTVLALFIVLPYSKFVHGYTARGTHAPCDGTIDIRYHGAGIGEYSMTLKFRRVVAGHDQDGRAIVKIDEMAKNITSPRPGVSASSSGRPTPARRIIPEISTDRSGSLARRSRRLGLPHPRSRAGCRAANHRTDSIDYAIVLSGEIDVPLDDSVVHLKAGDVLVQRGTIHNWVNRGTEPWHRLRPDRRETGHGRRQTLNAAG